jgi:hypothetical protein
MLVPLLPLLVRVTQHFLVLIAVVERLEAIKASPTELGTPRTDVLPSLSPRQYGALTSAAPPIFFTRSATPNL